MPLTTRQVQKHFGKFTYHRVSGSRWIEPDPIWVRENIVKVHVPELAGIPTYGGRSSGNIRCHHRISHRFQGAFARLGKDKKYLRFYGGAYAPRLITGGTALSRHSWGIAIDINCNGGHNAFGKTPDPAGSTYSMHEIADVFAEFGFEWGGKWKRPDGMHLEFAEFEAPTRDPVKVPFITVNGERVDAGVYIRDGVAHALSFELSAALGVPAPQPGHQVIPVAQFARAHGYHVAWIPQSKEIRLTK